MHVGYETLKIILYVVALLAVIGMFWNARRQQTATTLAFGIMFIGSLMEIQTLIFEHIIHIITH